MALVSIDETMLSDLVLNDNDPSAGRSRRVINVTTAADLPLGTVVFRAITSGELDQGAAYGVAADTDLVAANEFAVVFGDKLGCKAVTKAEAGGTTEAVAFVGFDVILKDQLPIALLEIDRGGADHKALKALLERQGIILAETLGA